MTTDHSHLFIGAIMRKLGVDKVELSHHEIAVIRRDFDVKREEREGEKSITVRLVPLQK